jgi:preprotein translocase subunit SecE
VNRQTKREAERQRRRGDQTSLVAEMAAPAQPSRPERPGVGQFLREVRGEMKRVAWPSRKEVASYSVVVLVTVAIMMGFIFALDSLFGQFVLWIFG